MEVHKKKVRRADLVIETLKAALLVVQLLREMEAVFSWWNG